MIKKYEQYLVKLFLKNIFIIITVFLFLSFFLNIFEEIKYFENKENEIYYPIILTILNIPSIIFDILPFIFLLGVMFFFINLYEKDEIELLRSHGINNYKITAIISLASLAMGILLIIIFYSFSANLKSLYLNFKYQFSNSTDHLAVVNEDGLWIKEKNGENIFIINAKNFQINNLENIKITKLDKDYKLLNTIISNKANIESKKWVLYDVKIFSEEKNNEYFEELNYNSSFNSKIISNLYSNLNSLNIFELLKLEENYKSIGYSSTEIKLHLNKLYSLPIYLTLTTIIGALLMFKLHYIKSKFFLVVIGVLVSVVFYYMNYFAILFGKNETLPVAIAIWLPQLLIFLMCSIGLMRLNEN